MTHLGQIAPFLCFLVASYVYGWFHGRRLGEARADAIQVMRVYELVAKRRLSAEEGIELLKPSARDYAKVKASAADAKRRFLS